MDGAEEIASGFVAACGDGAAPPELGKEELNQVARLVEVMVVVPDRPAVGLGRDHGHLACGGKGASTRLSASNALSAISVSAPMWGRRWSALARIVRSSAAVTPAWPCCPGNRRQMRFH